MKKNPSAKLKDSLSYEIKLSKLRQGDSITVGGWFPVHLSPTSRRSDFGDYEFRSQVSVLGYRKKYVLRILLTDVRHAEYNDG